jgi:hypothetical protein
MSDDIVLDPIACYEDSVFALRSAAARDHADQCVAEIQRSPGMGEFVTIGRRRCFAILRPLPRLAGTFAFVYHIRLTSTATRVRPMLALETSLDSDTVRSVLVSLVRRELRNFQRRYQ